MRSHVAVKGSADDVKGLQEDRYRTNFTTIGPWIDAQFGMDDFFENFLTRAKSALHSFTHGGVYQLSRRFDGYDLKPHYEDAEITEVIWTCTTAAWMATNLVTKHLGFTAQPEGRELLGLTFAAQNAAAK